MSKIPAIRVYVINLESATKRWLHIQKVFAELDIPFSRVPAIDGQTLKLNLPDYSERWYHCLHGRKTNPPEVGCYLSHLRALGSFLETDAEFALICEDDIAPNADLMVVLWKALALPRFWNVLRLSGLTKGHPLKLTRLHGDYWLCLNITRLKGSGTYVVDRKAAHAFTTRLLPMVLPYDHAIDREWFHGLTAACIFPFPVTQRQKRFGSAIQTYAQPKLPSFRRWMTTYPYQAFNEFTRWICRGTLFLRVKIRLTRPIG
jgi:glycosyl transferase, family 25